MHKRVTSKVPPPAMGRHGINKNRFMKSKSVLGKLWDVHDLLARDDPKPWRFSTLVETLLNEHYPDVISPGWLLSADEGMHSKKHDV
eukprot:4413205-Pleurochrysis_carterae.AAC.1